MVPGSSLQYTSIYDKYQQPYGVIVIFQILIYTLHGLSLIDYLHVVYSASLVFVRFNLLNVYTSGF